jgi:mannitol-1-/sugar-/sorbitol-6-phosphatase
MVRAVQPPSVLRGRRRVEPFPYDSAVLRSNAVLFDLDGVLVDSSAAVERVWRAWALTRGGVDPDVLMSVVHGRRAIDTVRAVAPHLDARAELAWLVDGEASDTEGVVALPGAARLLAELPAERWAVVTSGVRRVAEARLASAGLPIPSVLIVADEIVHGKPHPEGYLTAAARLGVAPGECLVVEDAPAGATAGRAAGMHLVVLTTTHAASDFTDADAIVPTLDALSLGREAPLSILIRGS